MPITAFDQLVRLICRYASMDVGVLLQQLENTPGVVVLITNKVCTPLCAPRCAHHPAHRSLAGSPPMCKVKAICMLRIRLEAWQYFPRSASCLPYVC